jgi:hypothetical protein
MKKQKLPKGWTEEKIRDIARYYDKQSEEEQAAEIDAAFKDEGQTMVAVPTALVPEILKLIERKQRKRGA